MKKEKSLYEKIISGEAEPEGSQKGWNNLKPEKYNFSVMDKEKHREISRKGAQAVNKLHGEKKTAKQALENILTLKVSDEIIAGADLDPAIAAKLKRDNPDATLYDLIQIVAAGRAVGGNIKAAEYIRDTYGDKPVDKVDISGEIMTETDRAMLEKISRRLDDPGLVIAKDISQ
jgi:general stress protein YciG